MKLSIIFLSTLCAISNARGEKTSEVIGNKKFHLYGEMANWNNATLKCIQNNSKLATIKSVQEQNAIHNFLEQKSKLFTWLGATDVQAEGKWIWQSDGSDMNYSNWFETEPNNLGNNEHCLGMRLEGKWYDYPCYYELYVLCEEILEPLSTSTLATTTKLLPKQPSNSIIELFGVDIGKLINITYMAEQQRLQNLKMEQETYEQKLKNLKFEEKLFELKTAHENSLHADENKRC